MKRIHSWQEIEQHNTECPKGLTRFSKDVLLLDDDGRMYSKLSTEQRVFLSLDIIGKGKQNLPCYRALRIIEEIVRGFKMGNQTE